jgi:hypothetical protein
MSWKACWDITNVQRHNFIRADVAEIDPRFLDALHVEPTLRMRAIPDRGMDSPFNDASEDDLLAAISSHGDGKTNRFIALTGGPGTGKSHLLHWAYRRLQESPPDWLECRYIPKSCTNLREIVRTILGPPDSQELEALHERVGLINSPDSVSEGEMMLKLAQNLEVVLEFDHHLDIESEFGGPDKDAAKDLLGCAGRGLPGLVSLPEVKTALRDDGSVLNRCIRGLVDAEARNPIGIGSDVSFTTDDLAELVRTAEHAGATFTDDLVAEPELTVSILNHALDVARGMTVDLASESLAAALRRLREILTQEDESKELLVMFEDFSDAKGIQATLLKEFEIAPLEGARLERCPVRFAIAITNEPYRGMRESYLSRARTWEGSAEFSLDQEAAYSREQIEELFGRYMNLARLGPQSVLDAGGGAAASHCDSCVLKSPCHETFGSQAGFGLFPLNAKSIHRLAFPGSEKTPFNPRQFLVNSAVYPTLRDAPQQLDSTEFPSGQLDAFPTKQLGDKRDAILSERAQSALAAAETAASARGTPLSDLELSRFDNILRWWKPTGESGEFMAEALSFPTELVTEVGQRGEQEPARDDDAPSGSKTATKIDPEKRPTKPPTPEPARRDDPRLPTIIEWADSGAHVQLAPSQSGKIQQAVWNVLNALHIWPETINESSAVWGKTGNSKGLNPIEGFCIELGVKGGANIHARAVGLAARGGFTVANFERKADSVETLKAIVRLDTADKFAVPRSQRLLDLARVDAFKLTTAEKILKVSEAKRKQILEEHVDELRRSWWFTKAAADAPLGSLETTLDLREQELPSSECGRDWIDLTREEQAKHSKAAREIARFFGRSQGIDGNPKTTVLDLAGARLWPDPEGPELNAFSEQIKARIDEIVEKRVAFSEALGNSTFDEVARATGDLATAQIRAHGVANQLVSDLLMQAEDQITREAINVLFNWPAEDTSEPLGLRVKAIRELDPHWPPISHFGYLLDQVRDELGHASDDSATKQASASALAAEAEAEVTAALKFVIEARAIVQ